MDELLIFLTYVAVAASSISGALEARKRQMDLVGAITIAYVTAFGGGTVRDLLLGRTPVFWMADPALTVAAFVLALVAFYRFDRVSRKLLIVADAVGLGLFSILGATYAFQFNLSPIIAVHMGVVTGIFGGVLRDVLSNQIPQVFGQSAELYATCSFVGTTLFIVLYFYHLSSMSVAAVVGASVIFAMRLLAARFKVTLPSP
ncbi:MAG: trimeric intracellular cation channel family protein [Anaerolineales bacterium]|nr:trimeric intracellular cation channel family protein [Anaerolineales bacterium]